MSRKIISKITICKPRRYVVCETNFENFEKFEIQRHVIFGSISKLQTAILCGFRHLPQLTLRSCAEIGEEHKGQCHIGLKPMWSAQLTLLTCAKAPVTFFRGKKALTSCFAPRSETVHRTVSDCSSCDTSVSHIVEMLHISPIQNGVTNNIKNITRHPSPSRQNYHTNI